MEKTRIASIKSMIIDSVFRRMSQEKDDFSKTSPSDSGVWIMDFRNSSLNAEFLATYTDIFYETYKDLTSFQVCGLESAAIPLVTSIVIESKKRGKNVNGMFIRKGRKKYDLSKNIEGEVNNGPVIVVDDVVNSGKTIVKQIETLKSEGLQPKHVFGIIRFRDRDFYNFLEERGCKLKTLFELNDFEKELNIKNLTTDSNEVAQPANIQTVWKFAPKNPNFKYVVPKSAPLLYKDSIYFGTDSGFFYCLDKKSGDIQWSHKIFQKIEGKAIFSSPIAAQDQIIFGAYDGNLYSLDSKDGTARWIYMDADWIGSSPCYSDKLGLIYVGLEYGLWNKRGGIVAINIYNGKEVWKDLHQDYTHSSPYYSKINNIVISGSNDGFLRVYNAKDGTKLQELNIGSEMKYSFAESADGRFITFGAFNGKCYIFDVKKMKLSDSFDTLQAIYSNPAFNKDTIIVGSLDKHVYCYDYKVGAIKWKKRTSGRIFASPLIDGDTLYIGSNDGRLYRIDTETGNEIDYMQFSERILNKICLEKTLGETFIYVPTIANEIYCIKIYNRQ